MRKRRNDDSGGFNIWRSYSDMMAGVLLLFVLIMCVTLFQAQKNYDDSIRERTERVVMEKEYTAELSDREKQLEEQAAKLAAQQATLDEQSATLSSQQTKLDEQSATLSSQQTKLDEQSATLAAQQTKLDEQSATLATQQTKLDEQSATLAAQSTALEEKTQLLAAQQQKIDNIIGVKADVISALKNEFVQNNIVVNIDEDSGALTLASNVIFDYDEAVLKEEGQEILAEVLPIYCRVLLQDQYLPYLAEVTIDGYTDSLGDYFYNLELSQARSKAVGEFLLELMPEFLNDSETVQLMEHLTVNAHSMSNFIYDADGNVDDDASRRVEIKFRLKDEEMIRELNQILVEAAESQ